MTERWKAITIRLYPENPVDQQLIDYLTVTGSPVTQLRALWKSVTTPPEVRNSTLGARIEQLKHLIEKTDSDYLLRRMTEEEYTETLKAIGDAIESLERGFK